MSPALYRAGNAIVLKPRSLGSIEPQGTGQIVAVLPEVQGSVRYRVRLHNENFDRNISQEDIDPAASSAPIPEGRGVASREAGKGWINSNSIRTKK